MGVPYDTALDDRLKETFAFAAELPEDVEEEEELPDDPSVSGPVPQPLKSVKKRRQRINITDGRRNFRNGLLLMNLSPFLNRKFACVQHHQSIVNARIMLIKLFVLDFLRPHFLTKTGPNINQFL